MDYIVHSLFWFAAGLLICWAYMNPGWMTLDFWKNVFKKKED